MWARGMVSELLKAQDLVQALHREHNIVALLHYGNHEGREVKRRKERKSLPVILSLRRTFFTYLPVDYYELS